LKDPIDSTVSVRLTLAPATACDSSSSSSSSTIWVPAQVLYCFSNYLDLAVLQISPGALARVNPGQLQPLQLVPPKSDVTPGDDAYVIGHGLFGPQMGLAPAVSVGCVGRVAALPVSSSSRSQGYFQQQQQQQGWRASMVISTAAVHSGASGGALVDAAGRLVGLVTSNARHVKGRTLPHLNFCISAAELRPVWDWAQQQQQQQREGGQVLLLGAEGVTVQDAVQDLKRYDVESVAGSRLWALQPYLPTSVVQPASSL
jgi:S1-C subfamily serine protease